jgi:hypothetical protein
MRWMELGASTEARVSILLVRVPLIRVLVGLPQAAFAALDGPRGNVPKGAGLTCTDINRTLIAKVIKL